MTVRVTISLPPSVAEYARSRVRHGGYGSISEYFRELVRIDQRFEMAKRDQRPVSESRSLYAARNSSGDRHRP